MTESPQNEPDATPPSSTSVPPPPPAADAPPVRATTPSRLAPSLAPRLQPAQESLAPGARLSSVLSGPRTLQPVVRSQPVARPSGLLFEERGLLLKR